MTIRAACAKYDQPDPSAPMSCWPKGKEWDARQCGSLWGHGPGWSRPTMSRSSLSPRATTPPRARDLCQTHASFWRIVHGGRPMALNASNVICYLPPAWVGQTICSRLRNGCGGGLHHQLPESGLDHRHRPARDPSDQLLLRLPRIFEGHAGLGFHSHGKMPAPLKQWMYALRPCEAARRVGSDIPGRQERQCHGSPQVPAGQLVHLHGRCAMLWAFRASAWPIRQALPSAPSCFPLLPLHRNSTSKQLYGQTEILRHVLPSGDAVRRNSQRGPGRLRASSSRLPTMARCWSRCVSAQEHCIAS